MNFISKIISAFIFLFIFVSNSVLANEPPVELPIPWFSQNAYLEADLGYVNYNWQKLANAGVGPFTSLNKFATGGVAAGGAVGYQYWRFVSFELGYLFLSNAVGSNAQGALSADNWMLYFDAKIFVPLHKNFDLIVKVGYGLHQIDYNGAGAPEDVFNQSTVIYGAGLEWRLPKQFYLIGQWLRVPMYANSTQVGRRIPSGDLFLLGGGYLFLI